MSVALLRLTTAEQEAAHQAEAFGWTLGWTLLAVAPVSLLVWLVGMAWAWRQARPSHHVCEERDCPHEPPQGNGT